MICSFESKVHSINPDVSFAWSLGLCRDHTCAGAIGAQHQPRTRCLQPMHTLIILPVHRRWTRIKQLSVSGANESLSMAPATDRQFRSCIVAEERGSYLQTPHYRRG